MISTSSATTLFQEDFESDLSNWTGKSGNTSILNGKIVDDPDSTSNKVLSFTALNAAGDTFTTSTFFFSASNFFTLSFDYYGTNNDSGGFIGYSYGLPDSHVWLAGSDTDYVGTSIWTDTLIGDNNWNHYSISFTANTPIHIMLEEFRGSDTVTGNAYFDNIELTAVPEPGTFFLLGLGILGLTQWRRKKS